jgi:hypothetical protein
VAPPSEPSELGGGFNVGCHAHAKSITGMTRVGMLSALKGQNNIDQGNALGQKANLLLPALKGRNILFTSAS